MQKFISQFFPSVWARYESGRFKAASGKYRTLVVGLIGVLVLGVGGFLVHDLRMVQEQSQRMYAGAVHGLDLIGELQYQTQEARRSPELLT